MHRADALVTHVFQRARDGLALRIEHGLFRCHNDFGFHSGAMLSEPTRARQFFPRSRAQTERRLKTVASAQFGLANEFILTDPSLIHG